MRRSKHNDDSRLFFDWLEMAARDLLAARLLIEQRQCLEVAGFHCQQCIEKALKAYIIHRTNLLVDGHNLTWLCRQAAKHHIAFREWLDKSTEMNRLYIETRYPSDVELSLSPEEARDIYSTAEQLYSFVCDEIYDGAEINED